MSSEFVTEFVAEQPLVVVVGNQSSLVKKIIKLVSDHGLQVRQINPTEENKNVADLLKSAYKIIWVNQAKNKAETQYQQAVEILKQTTAPAVVVQPVITDVKAPQQQQSFGYDWAQQAANIREQILDINYQLPEAVFIFGQDLVSSSGLDLSPLTFCLKQLQQGTIFDPEINWHLQSVDDFASTLKSLLFRPQSAGSFLVKPPSQSSTTALQQVKNKYEQYHSVGVLLRSAPQVVGEALPFSVTTKESEAISQPTITKLVRQTAAPKYSGRPEPDSPLKQQLSQPKKTLPAEQEEPAKPARSAAPAKQAQPAQPAKQNQPGAAEKADAKKETKEAKETKDNSQDSADSFDVNSELQKIFASTRTDQRVKRVKSKAKTEKKQRSKSKRRTALFWGGVTSIGLALGVLVLAITFFTSQFLVKQSLINVVAQTTSQPDTNILEQDSWSQLKTRRNFLAWQTNTYSSIFATSMLSEATLLVELAEQMEEMTVAMEQTGEVSEQLTLQVLGIEDGNSIATAQELQTQAYKTYENLSLLQAGLSQVELGDDDQTTQNAIEQYRSKVKSMRQSLAVVQQLDPHLASLTGRNGKKTYALLLQNNQELRPTGGFIQAVALLSFDRGSLVSYQVYSSYQLDSMIPGTTAPPPEVSQYLGEDSWYFRDSNWNPDFPATASQVEQFLERGLDTQIDGVIGMNLFTVEDLIEALGPLDVPEHNETLTHRNLQERMEFHSEVVLLPNSDTKDYAVLVLEKLLKKIKTMPGQKATPFLAALGENLQTQQLTIAIFDDSIQETMASLGWTGGLVEPLCPGQLSTVDCTVDSIAQIEANVGVNKANYYLNRSIDHTISLGGENAQHQRLITFRNTAETSAWPKGNYRSYVRFYLPAEAEFGSIAVDGEPLPNNQLTRRQVNNKQVVGTLIDVPISSQLQLELNYTTPLATQTPFSYAFFNQKQSGTTETPVTVRIISPSQLQPSLIAPQAEVVDNTIIFDNISEKHSFVGVTFQ